MTGLLDRFSGDKVIFLIALFLMLISVISVFSSTPLLALELKSDRTSIMVDQLKLVGLGFLIILALYGFFKVEWYRKLSRWGFIISFALLAVLALSCKQADPYGYVVKDNQIVYNTPPRPADQQSMLGFAAEPIENVRVGLIGLGDIIIINMGMVAIRMATTVGSLYLMLYVSQRK